MNRITKMTTMVVLLAGLALGAGSTLGATETDTEALRADLADYLESMASLPPATLEAVFGAAVSPEEARASVAELMDSELAQVAEALGETPYWRSLPRIMERRSIGVGAARRAPAPEAFEAGMLEYLGQLEELPRDAVAPGFHERVEALAASLRGLSDAELLLIERELAAGGAGSGPVTLGLGSQGTAGRGPLPGARAAGHCSNSFPDGILCQIGEIFDEVKALPGQLGSFLETQLQNLLGDFQDALDQIPDTPEEIFQLMDIDFSDPNWFVDKLDDIDLPTLNPPCPDWDNGDTIPGLGEMGSIRATYACKKGIDWLSEAIYDNAPDDVWGIPAKVPMMFVYYPVNYLCLCVEEAARLQYDDLQAEHRDFVEARFADDPVDPTDVDVDIASRATQLSIDESSSRVAVLRSTMGVVSGRLSVIAAKLDDLTQGDLDQIEFLERFTTEQIRLRVEDNLVARHPETVSLFQLPASVGGLLDEVRGIVADTLDVRRNLGRDMSDAEGWLDLGDTRRGDGQYKLAYDAYRQAYERAVETR